MHSAMSRFLFPAAAILAFSLAVAVVSVYGQQPIPAVLPAAVLQPQLDVELVFVKKVCAPSKDQLRNIKQDLDKCLREAAEQSNNSCDLFPEKLTTCVANHLSKEQAAHYRVEVERRKAHERAACVGNFVALLDVQLDFLESQRKSLVSALTENWKPDWSQMVELAVRNGDDHVPPIPDNLILPLLDPAQAKLWSRLPKTQQARQSFDASRIGEIGTPTRQPDDE
jgi:hypothetical protein